MLGACRGTDGRPLRPLQVGEPAPAYSAPTFGGGAQPVALRDLRGRAVLLNLWATWCPPCRAEMPGLERLHQRFADSGLTVIGVSVDGADADIRRFVDQHDIRFTIALDPDRRIQRIFRTIGVPETFLLDRQGRLVHHWVGEFEPAGDTALSAVRRALTAARELP